MGGAILAGEAAGLATGALLTVVRDRRATPRADAVSLTLTPTAIPSERGMATGVGLNARW